MTKHVHADLMLEYAKDAQETDKPWERWEYFRKEVWHQHRDNPSWFVDVKYRRKPKTILINGFEVPEPVREPLKYGTSYYQVSFARRPELSGCEWTNHAIDHHRLGLGLIHLTLEAAEAHAKALLSFTQS